MNINKKEIGKSIYKKRPRNEKTLIDTHNTGTIYLNQIGMNSGEISILVS